jgi:hypothetical protein
MQLKYISVCASLFSGALVLGLTAWGAVAAESCNAAVAGARAEWRSLGRGAYVAPAQHVLTSDGRRLAGSAINYGGVLISRAKSACQAGRSEEAMTYVRDVKALFHPIQHPF